MSNITNQKNSKLAKPIGYLLYCLFLAFICYYSFRRPTYNWDMLPYMAVVTSYDNAKADAHNEVYTLIKKELHPHDYYQLIDSNIKVKSDAFKHPEEFNVQMPFYVIKPLYTGLIYLFHKAGFSLIKSTVMPSVIAFFCIGLLLLYWLERHVGFGYALLLSVLILLLPPMLQVVKLSTPDCLSAFFVMLAVFLLVEKKSIMLSLLTLVLAIFTRLDNVVFCIMFLPAMGIFNYLPKKVSIPKHAVFILVLLASYFTVSLMSRSYGWSMFYYPSFSKHLNAENNIHKAFALSSYLTLAEKQIMVHMQATYLPVFIFLAAFSAIKRRVGNWLSIDVYQFLPLFCLIVIAARFVLQPAISDRFYIPYYLLILVCLVKSYAPLIGERKLEVA